MGSLIFSRHFPPTIMHSDGLTRSCPAIPFHIRRFGSKIRSRGFLLSAKNSSLLDFQDYTKPRRLLPATKPKLIVDESPEKIISNFQSDGSQSLYSIFLQTSSLFDSDLTDLNAGLLICIVDENGDSILQRIPAIICQDNLVHFQRGSTDEFIFWGPNLGRIQAMWISIESGKWRLADASLSIISTCNHEAEDGTNKENLYCRISYNFQVEDVLLGERSDMTVAELRPSLVTEYQADSLVSLSRNVKQAESLAEKGITNEESMREYAHLKYSLLLYDAMLIFAGTSISAFTADENTAMSFLTGGIGGFLYLLLLQRSVDELPAPKAISANKGINLNRLFGGLKGPLLILAFAFGIAILVTRHTSSDIQTTLTQREILAGIMGFFACKVSVILAAFKPISMDMKDNN